MITSNVLSSVNGVSNDGGNVDLVAGSNVTITPDDGANTITISVSGGTGGGNTLDQAYDQGGPGSGRAITADAGAFEVGGTDGVLFEGTIGEGTIPREGEGTRMMWYPAKGAFRVGEVDTYRPGAWDVDSIGQWSFASGNNTKASGYISTALGHYSTASGWKSVAMGAGAIASGDNSTALGLGTIARGEYSTAIGGYSEATGRYCTAIGNHTKANYLYTTALGSHTIAIGQHSTAIGTYTRAQSSYATAFGRYNIGVGDGTDWIETDPIFELGIGTDEENRKNAVTVLKNGRVGIGTHEPQRMLHVKNLIRLDPLYYTPGNASEGDIYMDGNTHKLMVYDGTQWQACW
jgi:hypothetical protein